MAEKISPAEAGTEQTNVVDFAEAQAAKNKEKLVPEAVFKEVAMYVGDILDKEPKSVKDEAEKLAVVQQLAAFSAQGDLLRAEIAFQEAPQSATNRDELKTEVEHRKRELATIAE